MTNQRARTSHNGTAARRCSAHTPAAAVLSVGGAYVALQLLGRQAGSTARERSSALPGDELVQRPQIRTDHAATINVPPADVWPWLTQMGWHLAGWYTPRWVDRLLFPDNWTALNHLDPDLVRDLRVGDIIPDGPPGTAQYVVATVEPPHHLVLQSTTHIPPGWETRFDVELAWTWSLNLDPLPGGRTRVHLRVRGRGRPWWFVGMYVAGIIPADYVMATGMLRGLKRRTEAHPPPSRSGRTPWPAASPRMVAVSSATKGSPHASQGPSSVPTTTVALSADTT